MKHKINCRNTKFQMVLLASFVFYTMPSVAQIIVDEELQRHYYDRTMRIKKFKDMKDFRDVFHYDNYLLGKNRISGNVSYNTGRVLIDDGTKIHAEYRSALAFFTRIRFFEEFSFNSTFYSDFNSRAAARWIADYSYSIGRYNWRPNKFNFGYENYINNKYSDNSKVFYQKFLEGYYFISYNNLLAENALNKIRIDSTTNMKFTYFVRYSVKYRNEDEVVNAGGLFDGKPTCGISCRYTIARNIYIESAVYFYFNSTIQKQPWDPDYSYGFGYFDWRSFRISLTYGNWAVNRFPWNKSYYPHYGFLDGNFKISANYIW